LRSEFLWAIAWPDQPRRSALRQHFVARQMSLGWLATGVTYGLHPLGLKPRGIF